MNWDEYYLKICRTVATNSKCYSRKIGSIIVKDKSIVSTGYNGPPRGVPECPERWSRIKDNYLLKATKDMDLQWKDQCKEGDTMSDESIQYWLDNICPRQAVGFPSGQGLHICIAGHAERNALINATRHGIAIKGATLYLDTVIPCKDCMIEIINAGIKEVVVTDTVVYDEQVNYLLEYSDVKIRRYKCNTAE